jgi:hypothetical protein
MSEIKHWEYRIITTSATETQSAQLDQMGEEGWELVAVTPEQRMYFKREKQGKLVL